MNLVTQDHVDVPFHNDREIGVVRHLFEHGRARRSRRSRPSCTRRASTRAGSTCANDPFRDRRPLRCSRSLCHVRRSRRPAVRHPTGRSSVPGRLLRAGTARGGRRHPEGRAGGAARGDRLEPRDLVARPAVVVLARPDRRADRRRRSRPPGSARCSGRAAGQGRRAGPDLAAARLPAGVRADDRGALDLLPRAAGAAQPRVPDAPRSSRARSWPTPTGRTTPRRRWA